VSERTRHIVLRGEAGDVLHEALSRALAAREVACGWLRASGVLSDVELRAFDGHLGAPSAPRRLTGHVQAIAIEGSVGLAQGEVTVGLRAMLARETDRGLETLAGEIVSAKVVALEAHVTAFDDLFLTRAIDRKANVWLFGEPAAAPPAPSAPRMVEPVREREREREPEPESPPPPAAAPAVWADAIAASNEAEKRVGTIGTGGAVVPPRIPKRVDDEDGMIVPEAGDTVEHFAFGTAEVLKSDGERLHLRAAKDGRIREIALEMLRVTPLDAPEGSPRRFRLDRKLG
jgi:predicted DNA-binding protein with PD1-like motif